MTNKRARIIANYRKANFYKANEIARDFIKEQNITTLPVDIFRIAEDLNITLIPFSSANQQEVQTLRKNGCDAAVQFIVELNSYFIIYDDQKLRGRIHFTITHEIGHIRLGHLHQNGYCNRSHKNDDPIEKEADAFAAELLRPAPLLQLLGLKTEQEIQNICDVTRRAANVGIQQSAWSFTKNVLTFYATQFKNFINKVMNCQYCRTCKANIKSSDAIFCFVCGSKNLSKYNYVRGGENVIYKDIKVSGEGKIQECPICQNEESLSDASYCKICGLYILNECSSNGFCSATLDGNARFCSQCGEMSTFFINGLLKTWKGEYYQKPEQVSYAEVLPDEDIPF